MTNSEPGTVIETTTEGGAPEREIQRKWLTERERDRRTEIDRDRGSDRGTEIDTYRETDKEREREREKEREWGRDSS